jgi:hypothetical protein
MIHHTEPQSEWDRRYKAYVAKKKPKVVTPKVKKKPGPKPGKPLPKKSVKLPLGVTVLKMMENP